MQSQNFPSSDPSAAREVPVAIKSPNLSEAKSLSRELSLTELTSRFLEESHPLKAFQILEAMDDLRNTQNKPKLTTIDTRILVTARSNETLDPAIRRITTGALLNFAKAEPEVLEALVAATHRRTKRQDAVFAILAEFPEHSAALIDIAESYVNSSLLRLRNSDRPSIALSSKRVEGLLASFPIGASGLGLLADAVSKKLEDSNSQTSSTAVSNTVGLLACILKNQFGLLEETLRDFIIRNPEPRADLLYKLDSNSYDRSILIPALLSADVNLNLAGLNALYYRIFDDGSENELDDAAKSVFDQTKRAFLSLAASKSSSFQIRKLVELVGYDFEWLPQEGDASTSLPEPDQDQALLDREAAENAKYGPFVKPPNPLLALPKEKLLEHVRNYKDLDVFEHLNQLEALLTLADPYSNETFPLILKAASLHLPQSAGYDWFSSGRYSYSQEWQYRVVKLIADAPYIPKEVAPQILEFYNSCSSILISREIMSAVQKFQIGNKDFAKAVADTSLWCTKTPNWEGENMNVGLDGLSLKFLHSLGLEASGVIPQLALRTLAEDNISGLQALAVIDNIRSLQGQAKLEFIDLNIIPVSLNESGYWNKYKSPTILERLLVSALLRRAKIDPEVKEALASVIDSRSSSNQNDYIRWNFGSSSDYPYWFLAGARSSKPQVLFPVMAEFAEHCGPLLEATSWAMETYFHLNWDSGRSTALEGKLTQVDQLLRNISCCESATTNIENYLRAKFISNPGSFTSTEALIACRVAPKGSDLEALLNAHIDSSIPCSAALRLLLTEQVQEKKAS